VLATLALGFAAALVLFLVFGHYTRRETVVGQVVPSAGLLSLAAPTAGTSLACPCKMVAVEAGDVLLELASDQIVPRLAIRTS
jgi:membrane fusion protein